MFAIALLHLLDHDGDRRGVDMSSPHERLGALNVVGIDRFEEVVDLVNRRELFQDQGALEVRVVHHGSGSSSETEWGLISTTQGSDGVRLQACQPGGISASSTMSGCISAILDRPTTAASSRSASAEPRNCHPWSSRSWVTWSTGPAPEAISLVVITAQSGG